MLRFLYLQVLTWLGRDTRGLFRFWDGRKWISADPIPVARSLMADQEFSWDETPKLITAPDPAMQSEAIGITARAVRNAFGLRAYDQGGLTEAECCQLLWWFESYMDQLKKNGSGSPTSREPTGQASSPDVNCPIEKSGLVSGLTETASDSSDPGMSCQEPMRAAPTE